MAFVGIFREEGDSESLSFPSCCLSYFCEVKFVSVGFVTIVYFLSEITERVPKKPCFIYIAY